MSDTEPGEAAQPDAATQPDVAAQPDAAPPATKERVPQSRTASTVWMISGLLIFGVGVVLTLTDPDNVILGVTVLAVGAVCVSVSGMTKRGTQRT